MGFPAGYTQVFFPKPVIDILSFLGLIKTFISSLLQHFLQPDFSPTTQPEYPPLSAVLIRQLLPVVKYQQVAPQSCAVCLYELEHGEEIRCLSNCSHIFHRPCLDRWMDHDQNTCPLCRTPLVPRGMQSEFNHRLWAASGISTDDYYYTQYDSVSGF